MNGSVPSKSDNNSKVKWIALIPWILQFMAMVIAVTLAYSDITHSINNLIEDIKDTSFRYNVIAERQQTVLGRLNIIEGQIADLRNVQNSRAIYVEQFIETRGRVMRLQEDVISLQRDLRALENRTLNPIFRGTRPELDYPGAQQ